MSKSQIEKIIALVNRLSEDTQPEDIEKILYHLELKKDIIEGLKQLDEGKGIPQEEVKKLAESWLK